MKFKPIALTILPMLAMMAAPVLAVEAEIDEVQELRVLRIECTVEDVNKADQSLEVYHLDGDTYQVDADKAIFIKDKGLTDINSVVIGQEVMVKSLAQKSNNHIEAKGVLIQQENTFSNFHIDTFHYREGGLVSEDFSLRLPEYEGITVLDEAGEEVDLSFEELDGANLVVIYSAATFSIPAIPLQPTIILLGATEEAKEQEDQIETAPASTPNHPATQPRVINMLDMLPFWARGGHVQAPQIEINVAHQQIDEETSEIVEEIIEEIVDENYFIGVEVLIDEEEVHLEFGK